MIVQEAPSLIISLFGSFGHGVALERKVKNLICRDVCQVTDLKANSVTMPVTSKPRFLIFSSKNDQEKPSSHFRKTSRKLVFVRTP